MAKKSTKTNETEGTEPQAAESAVVAKPKAEKKTKAESKPKAEAKPTADPKPKKAAKRAKKVVDPIGDETDGEAKSALEAEPAAETEAQIDAAENSPETDLEAESGETAAESENESEDDDSEEPDSEIAKKPRPPAKLERLQKILAKAGVASRRKAEEMIEQGRVQVNGKTVTELGTKADSGRDHIRVDGKLLQGDERHRYFVLNKPKGFVTTVKDPEGRPTVMQFFDKMRERLYPVGRLDYMSEGLLLVTNDGELANRLTRASAGVEKTYLVKVAGVPSDGELDQLRAGVAIERGKPGSARVRTSPARIRQVRQGDNPWYEVVLIEGRNRELRKMFEEVGHFVEKIRRVGYGPLVLDQEPGNLRELDERELTLLRKAADGTLRTPKSKEIRRRNEADKQLPTVSPRSTGARPARPFGAKPFGAKSFEERPALGPKDYRPKRSFEPGSGAPSGGTDRPPRPAGREFSSSRPAPSRPVWQKDDRPSRPAPRFGAGASGENRPPAGRPFTSRPAEGRAFSPKPPAGRPFEGKPSRPYGDKPAGRPFPTGESYKDRPAGGRPFGDKPAWKKPEGQPRPPFKRPPMDRPAPPRRDFVPHDDDLGPVKPPNLHIEEITGPDRSGPARSSQARSGAGRSGSPRPYSARPNTSGPRPNRPSFDRPTSDRPSFDRPSSDRPRPDSSGPRHFSPGRSSSGPSGSGRSSSERPGFSRPGQSRPPFRGEGGLARPFTTSSGKPRAGGARPNNKSGAPADRSSSGGWKKSGSRPFAGSPNRGFDSKPGGPSKRPFDREQGEGSFTPRPSRADSGPGQRPAGKPGWKPKPSFGGKGKPGGSKPGGKSRPSFKSGPKPGGKRPGSFGKKRP